MNGHTYCGASIGSVGIVEFEICSLVGEFGNHLETLSIIQIVDKIDVSVDNSIRVSRAIHE